MKCYNCNNLKSHKFKDCQSVTCQCGCINEIYTMQPNQNLEEVDTSSPHYLKISHSEAKQLPEVGNVIKKFNAINRQEWVNRKRRSFKRHRLG